MTIGIVVGGRFVAFDIARELARRGALAGIVSSYIRAPREGIHPALLTWNPLLDVRDRLERRLRGAGGEQEHVAARRFGRWAARHLPAADVLQLWTGYALESLPVARARGITTVVLRGSAHIEAQDALLREEYARFGVALPTVPPRMIERELAEYEEADAINVISRFAYETFRARGVPADRLILTPLGVDLHEVVVPPGVAPAPGPLRALFLGTISLRKGVQYLLQAARRLGDHTVRVTLAGGATADGEVLLRRFARPGEWRGQVPRAELGALLGAHDVVVLPSVEDGFGAVICEAMAAGVPVIASMNSGGPDVITDGVDGLLVPARSIEALAAALAQLADDRPRCRAMGNAARDAMRRARTWTHFVDDMLSQYESAHARRTAVPCAS